VQPLDAQLRDVGTPVVAIDALNRLRGDVVYLVRSGDSMFATYSDKNVPTDCAIGGLIDGMHVEGGGAEP
jgi:microcompartment protein CcmK/EutM